MLRSVRTGGNIHAFFSEFMSSNSFSLRYPRAVGWSFRGLAFRDAERRAKSGAYLWTTSYTPRKSQSSEMFVGFFSPLIRSSYVTGFWDF